MPVFTIFSISLSVLSLSNTIWCVFIANPMICRLHYSSRYYAYWNLFRCKPIRDVPSSLSLYNYKLSGVKDGVFSFAQPSHNVVELELSDLDKMLSVTITGSVLNAESALPEDSSVVANDKMPRKLAPGDLLGIELARQPDEGEMGI
jgi:hypothetical protein